MIRTLIAHRRFRFVEFASFAATPTRWTATVLFYFSRRLLDVRPNWKEHVIGQLHAVTGAA